jgi:hypothetical protein
MLKITHDKYGNRQDFTPFFILNFDSISLLQNLFVRGEKDHDIFIGLNQILADGAF